MFHLTYTTYQFSRLNLPVSLILVEIDPDELAAQVSSVFSAFVPPPPPAPTPNASTEDSTTPTTTTPTTSTADAVAADSANKPVSEIPATVPETSADMTPYHGKCHCGHHEWTVELNSDQSNHVLWYVLTRIV